MALPKKVIPNINLIPPKILLERREQLLQDITNDGTYLPKNLGYAEMDRGFLDFVKNELKTVVEGRIIPTIDILITTQNWAQFTQTWSFQDLNGNTEPPFITVVRVPEVKYGTNPATLYNIPNQKEFFYAAVPTWNGNVKGLDIYKIPQPVPVDISFSVKIVCNRMRELNEFNKNVLQTFASRQAYTKINGHFIPIVNTGISDESVTQVDKRRFYIQNYDFTLLGFLLDQDKFEVAPAVSRVLNVFETNIKPINRKRKRFPVNEGVFDLTIEAIRNSPVVRTISVDYTGTFTILSTQNVSTYDLFVRLNTSTEFDYYGTNVVNFEVNTGDQLRFEITQENADPSSTITYGVSFLGSPQNLTFGIPTPSITPTNTITPSITPTNTQTPSITPTNTQTPSITPTNTQTPSFSPSTTPDPTPNPTCTSTQGICYNYELSQVDAGGRGDWRFYSCSDGQLIEITIENNQIAFVCSRSQPVQFGGVFFNLPILLGQCGLYCVGPTPTPSVTKTQTPSISVTPSSTLTSTPTPTNLIVVQLVSSFGCGTINVPLILTNANNLTSISMTINYDDTNLSFVNIFGENPNLGFAYIINDIGGQIKFVWYNIEPKNLSGTLFNISFSANTSFASSSLSFDLTIPENNEITYGLQDNIASVSYINGTVDSTCPTPTPTVSNTPTVTQTNTNTPTFTVTPTSTSSSTPTPTITNSVTLTSTITTTSTITPTVTRSLNSTPDSTPTNTPTPSISSSLTPTISPTETPTCTPTITTTPTQTKTPTLTPTSSVTPSTTPTLTTTPTNTITPTNTRTPLGTPLPTRTPTITPTPTNTSTPTPTSSVTKTPTNTHTPTPSPTQNQCPSPASLVDCSGFTLNVTGSFIRVEYVDCQGIFQSGVRISQTSTICSITIPDVTYVAPDTYYFIIFTNVCGSYCNNLSPTPTKTTTPTPTPTTGFIKAFFVPCFIDSWLYYTKNITIWVQVNQTEVLINEKGTIYIENHPIYGNSCWRFAQIQNTAPGFSLINYQGLYFDNINQCMDNYGIKCPVSSGTTYMNL